MLSSSQHPITCRSSCTLRSRGLSSFFFCLAALCSVGPIRAHAARLSQPPPLWVSEVLADPDFAPDAQGEFIEVCGDPVQSTEVTAFELSVDGKAFAFHEWHLPAGQALVICRDSVAASTYGILCHAQWEQMSLANGRDLWVRLVAQTGSEATVAFEAMVPGGRVGESQENLAEYGIAADFRPATQPFHNGFATPGVCPAWHSPTSTTGKLRPEKASQGDASATGFESSGSNQSPFLPGSLPAPSSLKQPRLTSAHLSLAHPEATWVGFPSSYANGQWRLVSPQGKVMAKSEMPAKSAWTGLDALTERAHGLVEGPILLVLEKGSKRWMHALVVMP